MRMPKILISPVLALAILLTSPVRGDDLIQNQPPIEDVQSEENVESLNSASIEDEDNLPSGKEVSKEDTRGDGGARRRMWQNILLAAGAITVAIVAIILASQNNGHKK